jgi:quercetin dioxygenase-like cupin family protein
MIRADAAETLTLGDATLRLLLDADDTGGALSAHRVRLRDGATGAEPHRHRSATEVFHVLAGEVDLLVGQEVMRAAAGDLVVVPPLAPHAFAAAARCDAELLVLVTPGIQRFELFRTIARVRAGLQPAAALTGSADRYDNHPAPTYAWETARSRRHTAPEGARP